MPVGCAVGAMHPALIPAILSGTDARRAAANLTCVVAAMPTGILLRGISVPLFFDGRSNTPAPRFGPCSPARCTALHNAARQGDAGGVKALLAAGSDVHSTDPRGYSLRSHLLSGRIRVGECLLSDCRQCGECLGFADCRRGTGMCLLCRRRALDLASENGHTETAMALAKAGADVQCEDNDG